MMMCTTPSTAYPVRAVLRKSVELLAARAVLFAVVTPEGYLASAGAKRGLIRRLERLPRLCYVAPKTTYVG
jgi:hypothetical protein